MLSGLMPNRRPRSRVHHCLGQRSRPLFISRQRRSHGVTNPSTCARIGASDILSLGLSAWVVIELSFGEATVTESLRAVRVAVIFNDVDRMTQLDLSLTLKERPPSLLGLFTSPGTPTRRLKGILQDRLDLVPRPVPSELPAHTLESTKPLTRVSSPA